MHKIIASSSLAALLLVASCTAASVDASDPSLEDGKSDSAAATRTSYIEMEEWLNANDGADADAWGGITNALVTDFNNVCGDTFCDGDYNPIVSLRIRCSITTRTQKVRACDWIFAGSYETVSATTGAITVHAKTFTCPLPVGNATMRTMIDVLKKPEAPFSDEVIHRTLPGATTSIYDSLIGCI